MRYGREKMRCSPPNQDLSIAFFPKEQTEGAHRFLVSCHGAIFAWQGDSGYSKQCPLHTCGTRVFSMEKHQFRTPWSYHPSVPSPGLWVNTAFLPTVMKPSVFQNKYCYLVTNINRRIAHYSFREECARPTFLKSNGEVLPLFPSSPHTGKLPLKSLGIYMTKNCRGTQKYFIFFPLKIIMGFG